MFPLAVISEGWAETVAEGGADSMIRFTKPEKDIPVWPDFYLTEAGNKSGQSVLS